MCQVWMQEVMKIDFYEISKIRNIFETLKQQVYV